MTHGILIQARMGSTRLPGKVLMDLCGKPVLRYVIAQACAVDKPREFPPLNAIVVCIPDTAENDVLAEWLFAHTGTIGLYRGSEQDVAGRLLNAAIEWGLDSFVRLCADSPLIDPKLIRQAGLKGCYPAGQQAQYIYTNTLRLRYPHMDAWEHEHVVRREGETWAAGPSFTLDTPEDHAFLTRLIERMVVPHWDYGWEDLVALANADSVDQALATQEVG